MGIVLYCAADQVVWLYVVHESRPDSRRNVVMVELSEFYSPFLTHTHLHTLTQHIHKQIVSVAMTLQV